MEMKTVSQVDNAVGIGKNVELTDEGFLRVMAPVAKVGVMSYLQKDGSVLKQYVPATTLFDAGSLDTFRMKPVTNGHPRGVLLDSNSVESKKVGSTGETFEQAGDELNVSFTIMDQSSIASITAGRRELSPGYTAELDMTAGTFDGHAYDCTQVSRKYNHLALVDKARGGSSLRINIDGYDSTGITDTKESLMSQKTVMVNIDSLSYEAPAEVGVHIDGLSKQVTALDGELAAQKKEISTLKAEKDVAVEKLTDMEDKMPQAIADGVKSRVELEGIASVCLKDMKTEDIATTDSEDLKKKIVLAKFPKANLDGVDDSYLNSRLDSVKELIADEVDLDVTKGQRRQVLGDGTTLETNNVDDAYARSVADLEGNWEGGK